MQKEKCANYFRNFPPFFLQLLLSIVILMGLALLGFRLFLSMTSEDQQIYHQLIESSDGYKSKVTSAYKAYQQRFNVHKHLFLTEGDHRHQYRLYSVQSELIFDQSTHKTEIKEHFKGMQCIMQEDLVYILPNGQEIKNKLNKANIHLSNSSQSFTPKQYIRCMEADIATYYYKTNELVAQNVKISRYFTPGHDFISFYQHLKPIMQGTARQVNFLLSNQNKSFKAQGFQGVFQEIGEAL